MPLVHRAQSEMLDTSTMSRKERITDLAEFLRLKWYINQPEEIMKMFRKIRCKFTGHPLLGAEGEFIAPIPFNQPAQNLPFLDLQCPRCGTALKMYFLPGTRGMNTPAHLMAVMRWNGS